MQGTPHRMVIGVLGGLIDSAKSAGAGIMGALDKPPNALGGPQGVHHIPGRLADGNADAFKVGLEGIGRSLDQPVEQFGLPPDLGGGFGGFKGPRLPWRR